MQAADLDRYKSDDLPAEDLLAGLEAAVPDLSVELRQWASSPLSEESFGVEMPEELGLKLEDLNELDLKLQELLGLGPALDEEQRVLPDPLPIPPPLGDLAAAPAPEPAASPPEDSAPRNRPPTPDPSPPPPEPNPPTSPETKGGARAETAPASPETAPRAEEALPASEGFVDGQVRTIEARCAPDATEADAAPCAKAPTDSRPEPPPEESPLNETPASPPELPTAYGDGYSDALLMPPLPERRGLRRRGGAIETAQSLTEEFLDVLVSRS